MSASRRAVFACTAISSLEEALTERLPKAATSFSTRFTAFVDSESILASMRALRVFWTPRVWTWQARLAARPDGAPHLNKGDRAECSLSPAYNHLDGFIASCRVSWLSRRVRRGPAEFVREPKKQPSTRQAEPDVRLRGGATGKGKDRLARREPTSTSAEWLAESPEVCVICV